MKKNKIIQFSLVMVGIILFFFTYFSSDKDKIVDNDKNKVDGKLYDIPSRQHTCEYFSKKS